MNRPTLQNLIEKEYSNLDKNIQVIVDDEQTDIDINIISEKMALTETENQILFEEVVYTLFGYTPLTTFKDVIKERLDTAEEVAVFIKKELDETIFNKVKDFIVLKTKSVAVDQSNDVRTSTPTETINHQDILNEIENPTPSIYPNISNNTAVNNSIASDSNVLDIDNLELEEGGKDGNGVNSGNSTTKNPRTVPSVVTNSTPKTPTNNTVEASVPVLSGFKPIINDAHPAQPTADKLNSALDSTTKTPVREVYQSKKPDPYHEPLE